jgi:hypothetical protein
MADNPNAASIVKLADQVSEMAIRGEIRAAILIVIGDPEKGGPSWMVQMGGTCTGIEMIGALETSKITLASRLADPLNPTRSNDRESR